MLKFNSYKYDCAGVTTGMGGSLPSGVGVSLLPGAPPTMVSVPSVLDTLSHPVTFSTSAPRLTYTLSSPKVNKKAIDASKVTSLAGKLTVLSSTVTNNSNLTLSSPVNQTLPSASIVTTSNLLRFPTRVTHSSQHQPSASHFVVRNSSIKQCPSTSSVSTNNSTIPVITSPSVKTKEKSSTSTKISPTIIYSENEDENAVDDLDPSSDHEDNKCKLL